MVPELMFDEPRPGRPPRHLADLDAAGRASAVAELGLPAFRAKQLAHQYYGRLIADPRQMTDLPAAVRDRIAGAMFPNLLTASADITCDAGQTRKTLWRAVDGTMFESVLMRYPRRNTVCISSQAGCGMACPFCATGQGGLTRNLSTAEILEQVRAGAAALRDDFGDRLSNVVFMGMGEPLANYARVLAAVQRITARPPSAATAVQRYLPYATVLIGLALIALGGWLLLGRGLTALTPRSLGVRWAPTVRLGSMYGYGISYAVASLSCTIGPFLAVTGAGLRGGSVVGSVAIYLAYVAGLTLVVGVLAVAAATASSALADRLRRILPFVNRISGALLVVVGLYVGYYGLYELRLIAGVGANPQDAVIAAAGRLQGALAGWVNQHGAWPWAVLLVVLVVGAFAGTWFRRVRR